jgi:hypothetical protein
MMVLSLLLLVLFLLLLLVLLLGLLTHTSSLVGIGLTPGVESEFSGASLRNGAWRNKLEQCEERSR